MSIKIKDKFLFILFFLAIAFVVLKLWGFHISLPFIYGGGDDFVYFSIAKNVIAGHGFWYNANLAAPTGQELYHFPMLMAFFTNFCRLIGLLGGNWIIAANLYYLLSYTLAGVAFYFLGKTFEVKNNQILLIGAAIYSFWQYHFAHGAGHFTAIAYFVAPLFIAVCYRIRQGEYQDRKSVIKLIVFSALIGLVDIYYSFFGCYLLSVCLLVSLLKKQFSIAFRYLISILSVIVSIVLALFPAVLNMVSTGKLEREISSEEAYYYGFQLDSLFVPCYGSKGLLSWLTEPFMNVSFLPKGENLWNYVGIVGIAGIVLVFYYLIVDTDVLEKEKLVCRYLGATLLLGIVSGLSIFVAFLVNSIRCYNRIIVYVFALLLLMVSMFADRWITARKWGGFVVLVVFVIHMIDMSPWAFLITDYSTVVGWYENDTAFAKSVEDRLDDGEYVLQLPYVVGFENEINAMGNCNYHLRMYLGTKKDIGWSYGGLYGTAEDERYKKYDTLDVDAILTFANDDGFAGIYLDRSMYESGVWNTIYDDICMFLGDPDIVSGDNNLYYFDIEKAALIEGGNNKQ